MEEGSRRGIYEQRIPLCRRGSSGRVEGGTWAAGRSSLSRPLEIFFRGEREGKEREREDETGRAGEGREISGSCFLRYREILFLLRRLSLER